MDLLLIDIGGTKCSFTFDGDSHIEELATSEFGNPIEILDAIETTVNQRGQRPRFVAVSFGGQFDFTNQRVQRSVHKSGWESFSFRNWAKEKFDAECIADNDANCGALGEWVTRDHPESLVYVTVSTGIGAGLVINGSLYRGGNNLAGELGHVVIDPNGMPDELGNKGTLERLCGGYWIKKDFGKPASELLKDQMFFETYVSNLTKGLQIPLKILAPKFLVFGGGIASLGPKLETALQLGLKDTLNATETTLELSKLGKMNVLLGAKELIN